MTLYTLIEKCGTEVALGKELKYFWTNKDTTVSKHREGFVSTLATLVEADRLDMQIETNSGYYKVSDYQIPCITWIKNLVGFTKYVYYNEIGRVDQRWMKVTINSSGVKSKDSVLSPTVFKEVFTSQIGQYNQLYQNATEITKTPILWTSLAGAFVDSVKFARIVEREMNDDEQIQYITDNKIEVIEGSPIDFPCVKENVVINKPQFGLFSREPKYSKWICQGLGVTIPFNLDYAPLEDTYSTEVIVREITSDSKSVQSQDQTVNN